MPSIDNCDHAFELSRSDALKVVQSAKCFICLTGSMASIAVLWRGGLSWLGFRPLPRLLFIGHFSSSLICSTLFALCYAYDVDRLSQNHANPCDYLLDMQFAFLARIFPGLLSMAIPLSFLLPPVQWEKRVAVFNTKTVENAELFQILIWFEIIPDFLSLVIFHSALYLNHRRSPEETSDYLERRVQIESNKRVIHIVLPLLWIHFAFNAFTSFGLQLYPFFNPRPSLVARSIALECVNVIQLYPVALSLVLLYKLLLRPLQLPRVQISTILDLNKDNSRPFTSINYRDISMTVKSTVSHAGSMVFVADLLYTINNRSSKLFITEQQRILIIMNEMREREGKWVQKRAYGTTKDQRSTV